MRGVRRRLLAASAAVTLFMGLDLALVSPGPTISHAVEPPAELKWHQLVPPARLEGGLLRYSPRLHTTS